MHVIYFLDYNIINLLTEFFFKEIEHNLCVTHVFPSSRAHKPTKSRPAPQRKIYIFSSRELFTATFLKNKKISILQRQKL